MIVWAIGFFALAATAGIYMADRIFKGKSTPFAVALIHGGFGAAGLAALTFMLLTASDFGAPGLALVILASNALLGFFLFSRHLLKKPWPFVAVMIHGLAAISGVSILVLAFFATR
jgi:hypothetical protein